MTPPVQTQLTEEQVFGLRDAAWKRAWNDKEWEAWFALADAYLSQQRVIEAAAHLRNDAGVEDIDPRLSYVYLQVGRAVFDAFDAALVAAVSVGSPETRGTE